MGSFSIWHWLVVLVIVVLVFGTKRLKNVGQDLGEAIRGFKKGVKDEDQADNLPDARLSDDTRRQDGVDEHGSADERTREDAPRKPTVSPGDRK